MTTQHHPPSTAPEAVAGSGESGSGTAGSGAAGSSAAGSGGRGSGPEAGPTQIFLASTALEVVFLAAGIDSGAFDTAVAPALIRSSDDVLTGPPPRERVLLLSDNAEILEQAVPLRQAPGLFGLFDRFDRVLSLNEAIAPHHPNTFTPSEADLPVFERLLRSHWQLGTGPIELIVESPQVNPAIAVARIFSTAWIRVTADGLMSYGPTRSRLPLGMSQRMTSLHYAPLVPGLVPRLLHETHIVPVATDLDAVRAVVAEVAEAAGAEIAAVVGTEGADARPGAGTEGAGTESAGTEAAETEGAETTAPTALILGQYCAALGLITAAEEAGLHAQMLDAAAAAGCTRVLFKPHPAAPVGSQTALRDHAEALGMQLEFVTSPVIAEALIARLRPRLLISAFSTSLVLAEQLFGTPTQAVGTRLLLNRLRPYENSNRIPLTIIDQLTHPTPGLALQHLTDAVSYCMQAELLAEFRDTAVALLDRLDPQTRSVYFNRRRLAALDLPGRLPRRRRPQTLARRAARLSADYLGYRTQRTLRRIRDRQAAAKEGRRS